MADTKHVTIVQRTNNFHASISGIAGVFGTGGSVAEALGQLVYGNPELFGIVISSDIMPRSIQYDAKARA